MWGLIERDPMGAAGTSGLRPQGMWPSPGTPELPWEAGGVFVLLGGHILQVNTSVREPGLLPVTETV